MRSPSSIDGRPRRFDALFRLIGCLLPTSAPTRQHARATSLLWCLDLFVRHRLAVFHQELVTVFELHHAVRFHMQTVTYGCTTLVALPVKVGWLTVPAGVPALTASLDPLIVWFDGCVTLCDNVADGLPLVTALFVTLCDSVALGPAVVPVATPPVGFDVAIPIARALPPVAVLAMTCVPVVAAVVPPWRLCGCVWFGTSV